MIDRIQITLQLNFGKLGIARLPAKAAVLTRTIFHPVNPVNPCHFIAHFGGGVGFANKLSSNAISRLISLNVRVQPL